MTSKQHVFIPPNIFGLWTFTQYEAIGQEIPEKEPTIDDIDRPSSFGDVLIEQKGYFITFRYLQASQYRPILVNRIGTWRPILNTKAKLIAWELWLSDYNGHASAIIQVYEFSRCGRLPLKLIFTEQDSGFSKGQPSQIPYVGRAILIRKLLKE